jgi:hypothetical protein
MFPMSTTVEWLKKNGGHNLRFGALGVKHFWNLWKVVDFSETNEANFVRLGRIVDPMMPTNSENFVRIEQTVCELYELKGSP